MRRLEKTLGTGGWYRGRFLFFFLIMLVLLSVPTRSRLVDVDEGNSQNHDIVWMKFYCKSDRTMDRSQFEYCGPYHTRIDYVCLTSFFCSAVLCHHPTPGCGKHEYLLEESKLGSPPM